jgi:hypothetical protein
VISKILATIVNREKLQTMRKALLEYGESDDDLIIEEKYRRTSRIVIGILYLLYLLTGFVLLFLPMFESEEFSMPVYTQLPGTK